MLNFDTFMCSVVPMAHLNVSDRCMGCFGSCYETCNNPHEQWDVTPGPGSHSQPQTPGITHSPLACGVFRLWLFWEVKTRAPLHHSCMNYCKYTKEGEMVRQKDCRLFWGQTSMFLQCFTWQITQRCSRIQPATLLHAGHIPPSQALLSRQKGSWIHKQH